MIIYQVILHPIFRSRLEKFNADLKDENLAKKINGDMASGDAIGLTSTPTFIVNGIMLVNPAGYPDLKKAIDEALK